MSEIISVDFDSLPKQTRERLVACFEGKTQPAPIIASPTGTGCALVGWVFLLLVTVGFGIAIVAEDFRPFGRGFIGAPGPGAQVASVVVYALVFFFLVLCPISIARAAWSKKELPFRPGLYLFPCDVIDATQKTLRIVPVRLLSNMQVTHHLRNGVYQFTRVSFQVQGGAPQSFSVYGRELAEQNIGAFRQAQETLARAYQAQDVQTLWWADPFFDLRRSGVWQAPAGPERTEQPLTKSMPWLYRNRALVAGGLAILGAPFWLGSRILIVDLLSFSEADEEDQVWQWDWYIENGYFDVEEAKARRPKARLRDARAALVKAQGKGTVTAVREVMKDYADTAILGEANAHIHSLYEKTLTDFRKKASGRDPEMLAFMGRLVGFLEKSTATTVLVVFEPPTAQTLAEVDRVLAKKVVDGGKTIAPIAEHFDDQHLRARQSAIVSRLNFAFGQIFPTDVMRLEMRPTASTSEPALEIGYDVKPSGDLYTSTTDPRGYVGIVVDFKMKMRIPGDPRTFGFDMQVQPPKRFSTTGTGDEVVYDTMASRAFDEFDAKLAQVFFGTVPTEKP
jgi:hypothetical protein